MNAVLLSDAAVERGGRVVWSGANVTIESGSIVAVLGPNGAGKSTLLDVMLGLVAPSSGRVEIFGRAPRRGSRRVGFMAQSRRADSVTTITGRDYVGLGYDGPHWGWRRHRDKSSVVTEALALTGASAFADQPLAHLSGGQRQRVALAHATVFRPELLLLDEPLAALDLAAQAEIVDLIHLVRDRTGAAIVVVAHDLNPFASVVDQVLWIARGEIRSGTIDEVVNESVLTELYGHPIEIMVTTRGRRVIVGLEEEFAHPHPHPGGHRHGPEEAHDHFAEYFEEGR